jgi:apolipoprotein D and lipocalin family protein
MKGWHRENYRHSLAARGISVKKVDLSKYSGKWKQVASTRPWFQKDCKKVTAQYSLNPDGTVKVVNSCDGRKITGIARSVSSDNKNLKVSFGLPFPPGDYKIVYLDPQYKHAIVSSGNNTAWILARDKPSKEKVEELYDIAKSKGIDTRRLSMAANYNFMNDVGKMFSHPMEHFDREYQAYSGEYVMDKHPVDKAADAGVAIIGDVITLGNVQPLRDYEKGRSWKDAMIDIEFGREP